MVEKYMVGGVIRGTSAERTGMSTANLPLNTIFQETDTPYNYDLTATGWRQRGSTGGGTPGLFTKRQTYWVTKNGSTYNIYNKDGNIAQTGTDFQVAIQAQLDSMVNGDYFLFNFDTQKFTLNNPINIPVSDADANILKGIAFRGLSAFHTAVAPEYATQFVFGSTFPNQRHAIEVLGQETATGKQYGILDVDGFHFDNRALGRRVDDSGISITGGGTVRDVGAIKILHGGNATAANSTINIRNINTTYMWRVLTLIGMMWFERFENIRNEDHSPPSTPCPTPPAPCDPPAYAGYPAPLPTSFMGDNMITLQAINVPSSTNAYPKMSYFCNLTMSGSALYNNWLRIRAGAYNTFVHVFPDGGCYKETVFNLDATQDTAIEAGNAVCFNRFYHLIALDHHNIPNPDTRKGGVLYLNGTNCADNIFYDCLLPRWPASVKIAGGARRNQVELTSNMGGIGVLVDDMGAGEGNVVKLTTGFWFAPTGLEQIESYSGIVTMLDERSSPFELMGFTNSRKYGIDYCATIEPAGFGLLSHMQEFGTPALSQTIDGPYLSFPGSGNNCGRTVRATAATSGPVFSRQRNPKLTARVEMPNVTTARLFVGWTNTLPTLNTGGVMVGDTFLANEIGLGVGFRTSDSTYKVIHNGNSASATVVDTDKSINTGIRTIAVWASEAGTGSNNKWRVQIEGIDPIEINSGQIPSAGVAIYPVVLGWRASGTFFRLRGWQVETF